MYKALIKNNVALLAQYSAAAVVPLLLVPHIAKTIGIEEYGALAIIMAVAAYGAAVVQYSFHLTGSPMLAKSPGGDAEVFYSILAGKGLLFLGVAAALVVVGTVLIMPSVPAGAFWVLLLGPSLGAFLNSAWYLQFKDRFAEVACFGISGACLGLLVGLGMVEDAGRESMVWAICSLVASTLVVGLGTAGLSVALLGSRPRVSLQSTMQAMRDGAHVFASQVVSMGYSATGTIVVGLTSGSHASGVYNVIERISVAVLGGLLLIHTAAYPRLVESYAIDRVAYWRLLKLVVLGYLLAAVSFGVLAWMWREPIMVYLFGSLGPRPYLLFALSLVWIAVGVAGATLTGYLIVSGQQKDVLRITAQVLMLSLLIGIPGARLFGGAGWMGALVVSQLVVLLHILKRWKSPYEQ